MTSLLLWVLALQSLAIIIWGLMQRDQMIQFPFLAASVFLGWMFPQFLGLTNNLFLPLGGLDKTIVMAIICLFAAWLGYIGNNRPAKLFWWRFDLHRLLMGSVILSLLGAFFFYQVSLLAIDVQAKTGGQWVGVITIYSFFSKLLTVGMVIALIIHLNKPSWITWLILLFDLMFYLDRIIIKGRRAAMVELVIILLMAMWFHRRWLPPRWVMIVVLVVGTLVINSIGDYRNTMLGKDRTTWSGAGIEEIFEVDYVGNFQRLISGNAMNAELTNAVMNIEAVDRTGNFDFGGTHWNAFINTYVPGQWVGYDLKKSLLIDLDRSAYLVFSHTAHSGSTNTGLSDAFLSFWYFGAIKFFLIGLIMSRWYRAAVHGNIAAQMVLMLSVTASLHAITHSTHSFFVIFVQLLVFLFPVLILSRIKQRQNFMYCEQTVAG